MKKAFSFLILATTLFVTAVLQATEPEDILRNLPSPEVLYPIEEIRIKPAPESLATEPVPLPPPARPYEVRKLVEKAKETTASPIVKTTRKIVETLSRPKAKIATHTPVIASATRSIATGTQNLAAAKSQQSMQPTWVVKAAKTLAANPTFTLLDARIASETAFARDVFDLYVQGYESEEKPPEEEQEEQPAAKFDSIMVTATGLQKKAQWQELKNLFSENPEAGETIEGLRFQIEAEINSTKPNYMNAQRFARQLLESEADDPLGHYAMALFHYNSKKPNLTLAKKSLAIALKAKVPPAGASALYWTMTLKGLAIPLLLLVAVLVGGIAHLKKKQKAAALALLAEGEEALPPAPDAAKSDAPKAPDENAPVSGFKARLLALSTKARELLKRIPLGKGKNKQPEAENTDAAEKLPEVADTVGRQAEKATGAAETEIENSADEASEEEIEEDEEIYELEGEDSALLQKSGSDSGEEVAESDEVEEIIEEVVVEEDEGQTEDEVEIVEVEEDEDGEVTETVEEIIEEVVEVEEETEEVEYEVEEEVEYEDEPEEKK